MRCALSVDTLREMLSQAEAGNHTGVGFDLHIFRTDPWLDATPLVTDSAKSRLADPSALADWFMNSGKPKATKEDILPPISRGGR